MFLAENVLDSEHKVAVKVIDKRRLSSMAAMREEVDCLRRLDHPNIVKYFEQYESEKYLYLVMEYCPGQELFDIMATTSEVRGCFSEHEAA